MKICSLFCIALAVVLSKFSLAEELLEAGETPGLRRRQGDAGEWERMHVIRRIYGPENVNARREANLVEERMERSFSA